MRLRKAPPTAADRALLAEAASEALLPSGELTNELDRAQFFELYKLMVASSESLVARRQGVNTFFLTISGLLLTAISLFVRGGVAARLQAGGVFVLSVTGLALCVAWRSLLVSFGQLNRGKFMIINAMEAHLSAAIYLAEWRALGDGKDSRVYKSFTERETLVPVLIGFVYVLTVALSGAIWGGIWNPK